MTVEFAQRLKAHMERSKASQRSLAIRAGINHSTISRLLTGERDATAEVATGLVDGLGIKKRIDREEFLLFAAGYPEAVVENVVGHKPKTASEISPRPKI